MGKTGEEENKNIPLKYADGFVLEEADYGFKLTVKNPWKGAGRSYRYLLYHRDSPVPETEKGQIAIPIPIKSITCLSTTHVGFLKALGRKKLIRGVSASRFIYDSEIRKGIDDGAIVQVGDQKQLNYEKIVELSPDVILAYGIDQSSASTLDKLIELRQNVLLIAEYMEQDPLGKAEWLLVFGVLSGDLEKSKSLFAEIEEKYHSIRNRAENKKADEPTVFTGIPWKGTWYVPGGNSFQARLLEDASAKYIWEDNEETSGMGLNSEVVIDKAINADYWLNVSNYRSLEELGQKDDRFREFKAFSEGRVFNNNKRLSERGGHDYWESGVVHPHLILKDLVHIFHPSVFPRYQLYYYQRLE